jgi:hypothetical protein
LSARAEATIGVKSTVVGENDMTLYIFTNDTPDTSNCNADCLAKWPPFVSEGTPKLGAGVDAAMVGTATLADGRKIVTYNHMPLYYWVNDKGSIIILRSRPQTRRGSIQNHPVPLSLLDLVLGPDVAFSNQSNLLPNHLRKRSIKMPSAGYYCNSCGGGPFTTAGSGTCMCGGTYVYKE